jgi:hypothetical protein
MPHSFIILLINMNLNDSDINVTGEATMSL